MWLNQLVGHELRSLTEDNPITPQGNGFFCHNSVCVVALIIVSVEIQDSIFFICVVYRTSFLCTLSITIWADE